DRRRFAITVCYLREVRDPAFDLDRRAAELGLDYAEVRQQGPFDLSVLKAARRLVRERGIELVHAHDYKTNLLALALARSEGVIALPPAPGWTGQTWRERLVYSPADKRLLGRFRAVIAVSSEIRAELIRRGAAPCRVRTILNGIDPDAFRQDPVRRAAVRTRLGFAPTDRLVGAVGRLSRQKRFDLLLPAFARLRRRPSDLHLLLAGDGEERPALEAEARRLGLSGSCHFLGQVRDIADVYQAFDVFVQSSEYEGTPNVVLEAMAVGVPVVATAVGGTGEVIDDAVHGLIAPPRAPVALADAAEESLADVAAARARVLRARQRVETELSFTARQRKVQALYEELLAEGGRRRKRLGCERPRAQG